MTGGEWEHPAKHKTHTMNFKCSIMKEPNVKREAPPDCDSRQPKTPLASPRRYRRLPPRAGSPINVGCFGPHTRASALQNTKTKEGKQRTKATIEKTEIGQGSGMKEPTKLAAGQTRKEQTNLRPRIPCVDHLDGRKGQECMPQFRDIPRMQLRV